MQSFKPNEVGEGHQIPHKTSHSKGILLLNEGFPHILIPPSVQSSPSMQMMAAEGGALQQAKLVLLGDMGAGKSSVVLRFVKGQFFDYQVLPHGQPPGGGGRKDLEWLPSKSFRKAHQNSGTQIRRGVGGGCCCGPAGLGECV